MTSGYRRWWVALGLVALVMVGTVPIDWVAAQPLALEGGDRWRGPGHNAVLDTGAQTLLVYHAYDAEFGGSAKLRIEPLVWEDGWPALAGGRGGR